MTKFEEHSRRFIELSPFLVISTTGSDGIGDVSPRGDAPGCDGYGRQPHNRHSDRRGNNRIDTLTISSPTHRSARSSSSPVWRR